jgi:hypothetical protein
MRWRMFFSPATRRSLAARRSGWTCSRKRRDSRHHLRRAAGRVGARKGFGRRPPGVPKPLPFGRPVLLQSPTKLAASQSLRSPPSDPAPPVAIVDATQTALSEPPARPARARSSRVPRATVAPVPPPVGHNGALILE